MGAGWGRGCVDVNSYNCVQPLYYKWVDLFINFLFSVYAFVKCFEWLCLYCI